MSLNDNERKAAPLPAYSQIGGKGEDIASPNTTIFNLRGPQYIMNPNGYALNLTVWNTVVFRPFQGGANQQWTLESDGAGNLALRSQKNGLFVGIALQKTEFIGQTKPFYWNIVQEEPGYRFLAPNAETSLSLASSANLRSPADQSTKLYVLESTFENREAIKQEQIETAKQAPSSGGNFNVIVNDFSGSNSSKVIEAANHLREFLISDASKNLVVCLGHCMNCHENQKLAGEDADKAEQTPIQKWTRYRVQTDQYTFHLGNGPRNDMEHLYVGIRGIHWGGPVQDSRGLIHRSRIRDPVVYEHRKEFEILSEGPLFVKEDPSVVFAQVT
ncbi:hypothetical protein DL96DRAFT_1628799 [Flagelloscypha sp. PMI_526]|nr:hypothetical protein DL96DRAFT_1628799 [Flagelloscypha sp. PMI_526]